MLKKVENTEFTISGSPDQGIFGVIPRVRKLGGLNFLTQNMLNYGDIIPFHYGIRSYIQLNNPELIKYVLVNNNIYSKGPSYKFYREILGDGLLTSFGKRWIQDRKIIQPIFDRKYVEEYYSKSVFEVVDKVKQRWLEAAHSGSPVNVTKDMAHLTMSVTLKTMFSTQIDDETVKNVDRAINTFLTYVGAPRMVFAFNSFRYTRPILFNNVQKELKFMHELIQNLIDNRRKDKIRHEDTLTLLLEAKKEDGTSISDEELHEHIFSLIFAGYETTSVLLQWALIIISKHPYATDRLRSEIAKVDSAAPFSKINEIAYLDWFIQEVMRVYPPLWTTARMPIKDDVIGGYEVKAFTPILLPQYAMHRHPKHWKNPEGFWPEHFSPEVEKERHPYCYFPFSLGPRKCAGWRFAMMEAKIVLFHLLPLFDVELIPGQDETLRKIMSMRFVNDRMFRVYTRG